MILKTACLLLACLLLAACAFAPSSPTSEAMEDFAAAQVVLEAYLQALNSGDFQAAAQLYAGSLDDLRYFNPEIDPQDEASLLEAGCRINGLQCLALRQVTSAERLDQNNIRFTVEFSNPDGSLFVLGPCCGATETEMPSRAIFGLTVRQDGGEYYVVDMPPYTP